jgi:hypothetical protein
LTQLDKTAGKGNYNYILDADDLDDTDEDDDDDNYDYEDYEEENELVDEIQQMSGEERKKQFIELLLKGEESKVQPSDEETIRLIFLCQSIIYDVVAEEDIDKQLNRLEDVFEHEIVEEIELPNSLYTGIHNMDGETIDDLFADAYDLIVDNKSPKKAIAQLREKAGNVPVADFLELFYLKQKGSKKFEQKLEESSLKFPDYFLIQLYKLLSLSKDDWGEDTKNLEKLLSGEKQPITEYEAEFFFLSYFVLLVPNVFVDISILLAFEKYIQSLDFISEDTSTLLYSAIQVKKMQYLIQYFVQTGELPEKE